MPRARRFRQGRGCGAREPPRSDAKVRFQATPASRIRSVRLVSPGGVKIAAASVDNSWVRHGNRRPWGQQFPRMATVLATTILVLALGAGVASAATFVRAWGGAGSGRG